MGNSNGNASEPQDVEAGAIAPWQGFGLGYVRRPDNGDPIAVVLVVTTPHGPMMGAIMPDYAEQLAEQMAEHARSCVPIGPALEVVQELPAELRQQRPEGS